MFWMYFWNMILEGQRQTYFGGQVLRRTLCILQPHANSIKYLGLGSIKPICSSCFVSLARGNWVETLATIPPPTMKKAPPTVAQLSSPTIRNHSASSKGCGEANGPLRRIGAEVSWTTRVPANVCCIFI